eukprot:jgi/Galph1/3085/GphlegSOOS_G1748.1
MNTFGKTPRKVSSSPISLESVERRSSELFDLATTSGSSKSFGAKVSFVDGSVYETSCQHTISKNGCSTNGSISVFDYPEPINLDILLHAGKEKENLSAWSLEKLEPETLLKELVEEENFFSQDEHKLSKKLEKVQNWWTHLSSYTKLKQCSIMSIGMYFYHFHENFWLKRLDALTVACSNMLRDSILTINMVPKLLEESVQSTKQMHILLMKDLRTQYFILNDLSFERMIEELSMWTITTISVLYLSIILSEKEKTDSKMALSSNIYEDLLCLMELPVATEKRCLDQLSSSSPFLDFQTLLLSTIFEKLSSLSIEHCRSLETKMSERNLQCLPNRQDFDLRVTLLVLLINMVVSCPLVSTLLLKIVAVPSVVHHSSDNTSFGKDAYQRTRPEPAIFKILLKYIRCIPNNGRKEQSSIMTMEHRTTIAYSSVLLAALINRSSTWIEVFLEWLPKNTLYHLLSVIEEFYNMQEDIGILTKESQQQYQQLLQELETNLATFFYDREWNEDKGKQR